MWFFEVKYGKNCCVGGHFYSEDEMLEWFKYYLNYYVKNDKAYDIHIYYKDKEKE